jgi:hypothetical protein
MACPPDRNLDAPATVLWLGSVTAHDPVPLCRCVHHLTADTRVLLVDVGDGDHDAFVLVESEPKVAVE